VVAVDDLVQQLGVGQLEIAVVGLPAEFADKLDILGVEDRVAAGSRVEAVLVFLLLGPLAGTPAGAGTATARGVPR
jgi:hypothetical protein